MTHQNPPEHYKGKSVAEHLKDARRRGAMATSEPHGQELSGALFASCDSAKDTALTLLLTFAIWTATSWQIAIPFFLTLGLGYTLWKGGRSALLGWGRLERLHRVIEEERFEIEHHREQEKQELREMYEAKGFSGKLLDEVVEVLMADDNRLLQVMLEEELGLSLEVVEHPLRQATGAFLGALATTLLSVLALYFWPTFGLPLVTLLIVCYTSSRSAHFEKRAKLQSVIWNLALSLFAAGGVYFLAKLLSL